MPIRTACAACSLDIAGSIAIFFVPYITLSFGSVTDGTSVTIPISIGNKSTPAVSAIIHTLVAHFVKLSATIAVTSCPVWVTPSETTPLSAQKISKPFFLISSSALLRIPAIRITASSSFPRLNSGFATVFHRLFASSSHNFSTGFIILNFSINNLSFLFIDIFCIFVVFLLLSIIVPLIFLLIFFCPEFYLSNFICLFFRIFWHYSPILS